MNKTALTLLTLPLLGTAAHAQTAQWPLVAKNGSKVTIIDRCYRQGADIICEGSYQMPYDTRSRVSSGSFRLINEAGDAWNPSQVLLRGQDATQTFQFYAKISYPMKLVFKNYPGNSALRLDIESTRFGPIQFTGGNSNLPAGVSTAMKTSTPVRLGNQNFLMTLSDCQTVQGTVIGCKTLLTPQ